MSSPLLRLPSKRESVAPLGRADEGGLGAGGGGIGGNGLAADGAAWAAASSSRRRGRRRRERRGRRGRLSGLGLHGAFWNGFSAEGSAGSSRRGAFLARRASANVRGRSSWSEGWRCAALRRAAPASTMRPASISTTVSKRSSRLRRWTEATMQASGKAAAMRSSTRRFGGRIERAGRLVEQQQRAALRRQHAARQAQPLALAAREVEAAFGQRACPSPCGMARQHLVEGAGMQRSPTAPRRRSGWPKPRFSRTLASNTSVSCGISVARCSAARPGVPGAVDRQRAAAAASYSPASTRSSVLLPPPLGPDQRDALAAPQAERDARAGRSPRVARLARPARAAIADAPAERAPGLGQVACAGRRAAAPARSARRCRSRCACARRLWKLAAIEPTTLRGLLRVLVDHEHACPASPSAPARATARRRRTTRPQVSASAHQVDREPLALVEHHACA